MRRASSKLSHKSRSPMAQGASLTCHGLGFDYRSPAISFWDIFNAYSIHRTATVPVLSVTVFISDIHIPTAMDANAKHFTLKIFKVHDQNNHVLEPRSCDNSQHGTQCHTSHTNEKGVTPRDQPATHAMPTVPPLQPPCVFSRTAGR